MNARPGAADCDILIVAGRVLDLDSDSGSLDDHAVAISGNKIVDVGPSDELVGRWTASRTIHADGDVISPGFVDAHVHLSSYLSASIPYERQREPGLFSGGSNVAGIVPFVSEMSSMHLPAELTDTVLRPVFAAMLKAGITSVVDAGSAGHAGIANAAVATGIRASIGPSLADMWHDASGVIARRADHAEILEAARSFIEIHDGLGDGRVRTLVSAVETIACSDELLTGIAALADEVDVPTHIHSHITKASDDAHVAEYGATATQRLLDNGMLTERCTVMHAGHCNATDITTFTETGITVNHNPLGNALFGFASAQYGAIPAMLEAGVPIVLGSDYGGSMIASPFDSIRAALAINREAGGADDIVSIEQAIAMATNPGVPIGRPGRLGRIAVGQLADIVVIDTAGSHHLGDRHPVPSIAFRAHVGDVTTVIVDGTIVVDNHQLTTVDESECVEAGQALLQSLR